MMTDIREWSPLLRPHNVQEIRDLLSAASAHADSNLGEAMADADCSPQHLINARAYAATVDGYTRATRELLNQDERDAATSVLDCVERIGHAASVSEAKSGAADIVYACTIVVARVRHLMGGDPNRFLG